MRQAYRWDVTGALNIVKFRTWFAPNKRQLQRMSTTLRVKAPAPSVALQTESKPPNQEIELEESYSQRAVGKLET
jgi:hypothetical protein